MNAKQSNSADTVEHRPAAAVADNPALLDVNAVAATLGCSARHVYRLSDAGKMPRPRKLGALVRWSRQELDNWISEGCRPVRTVSP